MSSKPALHKRITALEVQAAQSRPEVENIDGPLLQLPMSIKVRNTLEQSGVRTVAQLCRLNHAQVLALYAIGRKALDEIESALRSKGLRLGQFAQ